MQIYVDVKKNGLFLNLLKKDFFFISFMMSEFTVNISCFHLGVLIQTATVEPILALQCSEVAECPKTFARPQLDCISGLFVCLCDATRML